MCGLNGIFAYHYAASPVDLTELQRTRDYMAARGPDGAGQWLSADGRMGLAHRRLSIIDLSEAGTQPMVSTDGNLVVTFNGEIYNHRELRRGLESRGHRFTSQSDTEVLLHLYAEKGSAMVNDLRGMFAFGIWDSRRNELFLARDPYGIKPLYYTNDGWTFRFASQVKALLTGGGVSHDIDPAGEVGFFLFGSVPEPFTLYREIQCLPAGSAMRVGRTGPDQPRRYQSISSAYAADAPKPGPATADAAIVEALRESLRAHLVADVPIGAFLSAGVDSGALVGIMRDLGADNLQTVTIAFQEYRGSPHDEAPLAEKVAQHYGTKHTTRVVTQAEFQADLPRILAAMDQPSIDGLNTWFVSKAAHEIGLRVAISGLGGDELLGGYPSFNELPKWVLAMALPSRVPLLGVVLRQLSAPLMNRLGVSPKAAGMVEFAGTWAGAYLLRRGLYMPWELPALLDPETLNLGLERLAPTLLIERVLEPMPNTHFGRVATMESSLYMRNQLLRDTDWASMAHSLEVRVPLVDDRLLSQLAPLMSSRPIGSGKRILAKAPNVHLPSAMLDRPKTGFTTPVGKWMRSLMQDQPPSDLTGRSFNWARDWSRWVWRAASAPNPC